MNAETRRELIDNYRTANDPDRHCSTISQKLLSGLELTEAEAEYEQQLDELIRFAPPITNETVVFSGRTPSEIEAMRVGAYPSFMSVTTVLGEGIKFAAQKGCLIKFSMPAGVCAVNVSAEADDVATLEVGEWLLPKGIRFSVRDWSSPFTDEEGVMFGFGASSELYEADIIQEPSEL
jgi:hypothetical protein